jgi:hypothetical protein
MGIALIVGQGAMAVISSVGVAQFQLDRHVRHFARSELGDHGAKGLPAPAGPEPRTCVALARTKGAA